MGTFPVFVAGLLLGRLVDDGAVLQTAQIEHPHAAICAAADEHVNAAGAEADVEDFLVVRDQLRFRSQSRNVPYRAGSVDAGGNDEFRGQGIPVKGRERCGVFGRLRVGEESERGEFLRRRVSGVH